MLRSACPQDMPEAKSVQEVAEELGLQELQNRVWYIQVGAVPFVNAFRSSAAPFVAHLTCPSASCFEVLHRQLLSLVTRRSY